MYAATGIDLWQTHKCILGVTGLNNRLILSHIGGVTRTFRGLRFAVGVCAVSLLLVVAGCGDNGALPPTVPPVAPTAAAAQTGVATAGASGKFAKAVLASSEMVVGDDRFVIGLLDPDKGQPINYVPAVSIQFFKVNSDGTATKTGDATPIYRSDNLPAGVYVSRTNFAEAGKWGAIVTITPEGTQAYQQKLEFDVIKHGTVPLPGDKAPLSKNQTINGPDVYSLDEICSAQPHDDMHAMTIADAVESGKPTVILFAAPGFCPSFTCGPDMELMQKLEAKYRDKANFVHIESPNSLQDHTHTGPFDAAHQQLQGHQGTYKPQVQTAKEWGLTTEPWLFFVDKSGTVVDRFEGGLTYDEVEPRLAKVLQ